MVRLDTTFTAMDNMTPEFAAKLSESALKFDANVSLDVADKRLALDSLICILALELYRGVNVGIIAEGNQESEAAEEIRRVLNGEL